MVVSGVGDAGVFMLAVVLMVVVVLLVLLVLLVLICWPW